MSNPIKPPDQDSKTTGRPPKGTTVRDGSGMGGNPNENLRTGQHRVSDGDADNGGSRGGNPGPAGKRRE